MSHPQSQPNPVTAAGVIAGFGEGIALAFLNKIAVLIFGQLAAVQQSLNPEQTLVDLGTIFTAWGTAYFLVAYVAPIVAAYVWADKAGVAVYFVGWLGTTVFLNGGFTVGVVLLIVASLLVMIVDVLKNASSGRRQRSGGRPPIR
jgi:isoprenylcysteine carboxyl methyltransferase (ICMT) family protein YpbQ